MGIGALAACGSFSSAPETTPPGEAAALPPPDDGASTLVCPEETVPCGSECVKLDADEHCGSCAKRCSGNQRCWSGRCRAGSPIGCSDGVRDAFVDAAAYPELAGCYARFDAGSLRARRTDAGGCGNDLDGRSCRAPADACEPGWHVCGVPPYGRQDVLQKVSEVACNTEKGRTGTAAVVAALGDRSCEPCSPLGNGAVCCGVNCVQQNGDCLWPGLTAWFGKYGEEANLCSGVVSRYSGSGVLCCHDPDPADAGDAGDAG